MAADVIEFTCPECGKVLHIAEKHAGESSTCIHCGARITPPSASARPAGDPADSSNKQYWFYAKNYGYGWGLPACWQGWAVFWGYIGLALAGIPLAFAMEDPIPFFVYLSVLTGVLFAICWAKGEPLAWRWGEATAASRKANHRAYLVLHLFLGPLLLGAGLYLYACPPSNMNHTYGYRTATSFQSQDAWDEAQGFSAKGMIAVALATMVYQGISIFAMKPVASFFTSVAVMLLGVIAVVPITEAHLNNCFDQQGKRIVQQTDTR